MSNFAYDLTIALIVKNEIKYLRRCLETLQPLREALSCQLIITDTGSTDGTKEVAQEFADVYLEFEWCNDFSKARNTGVEKAEGRWFFYVDADNDFDDSLLAIAEFLKRPNVDRDFDAASILIRSYHDTAKKSYNDIVRSWLLNFSKGKRFFKGAVHESIGVNQNKVYTLPTIMHHWGYLTTAIDKKNERNLPILRKMFEEDPSDLKNRLQLAKELSDPVEKRAFFEDSIAFMLPLAKKQDDAKMWLMIMRNHYQLFALHIKDYPLAERLIGEWTTYLAGSIFEINFFGYCMEVYLAQGEMRQELLFQTFPTYQKLFTKRRNPSDDRFRIFDNFRYATEFHYYQVEFRTIHQAVEGGRTQEAVQWLTTSNAHQYALPDQKHKYLFDVTHLCFVLEEYDFLSTVFTYALQHSPAQEIDLLLQAVEKGFLALSKPQIKKFLSAFSSPCLHWYQAVMKLRLYQNQLTLCPQSVQTLLTQCPERGKSLLLSPLLYSYLLTGDDPLSYLEQVSLPHLDALNTRLLQTQEHVPSVLRARLFSLSQEEISALPLSQKQVLGHLGLPLSLDLASKADSSTVLSLFWTSVSLLVHSVAERGGFASSFPHQTLEQSAVLLWQGQENPTSFAQAKQQALALCPSLAPLLSLLGELPPPSQEVLAQQKQQILATLTALEKEGRHTEACGLRTAFLASYPETFVPCAPSLSPTTPPLVSLKDALAHSLCLLDSPSSQAKKQLLMQQYQSLLP